MQAKYKRVLIKISGEALADSESLFDSNKIAQIAQSIKTIVGLGVQVGIVIGGGNIFRGRSAPDYMPKTDADHIGMLATVMNSIMLKTELDQIDTKCSIMSAIDMYQICEKFAQRDAINRLEDGEVVIFACGTGRPYFSTDTAAALRALEIDADILLCAKKVDGVYSCDPEQNKEAKKYDVLTYQQVVNENLKALDQAAFALCRDNNLSIFVFKLSPQGLIDAVCEGGVGTIISN